VGKVSAIGVISWQWVCKHRRTIITIIIIISEVKEEPHVRWRWHHIFGTHASVDHEEIWATQKHQ
jgi:hypothetical protein